MARPGFTLALVPYEAFPVAAVLLRVYKGESGTVPYKNLVRY
jgi:hypothetical protein